MKPTPVCTVCLSALKNLLWKHKVAFEMIYKGTEQLLLCDTDLFHFNTNGQFVNVYDAKDLVLFPEKP